MKKCLSVFIFIMITTFSFSAWAASDPIAMLQSLSNQMLSKLKANKAELKTNPAMVYSFANQIIVPHADISEVSKRVLPPDVWNKATPQQKAAFQREFTTLLVHTYAAALSSYKDETVNFKPIRGGYAGRNNIQVDSEIVRSDGPPISVSYRLILKGSQWKLYDLIPEGVSMIESFRSQFADKLTNENIDQLIQDMRAHNGGR